nr:trehalose-phosphatase [Pseudonocardiales bacterium]
GRDRTVVQALMGIDDLVVAGSHGFDIASPDGTVVREVEAGVEDLVAEVHDQVGAALAAVPGVVVEAKRASVAVHYRLTAPADRARVRAVVDVVLALHPGRLRVTPGKMVYELQPAIEWDKGRAVLYLLTTLGLDSPDIVPIYLGDDVTDEDAFTALRGLGVGVIVGRADDAEVAGRATAADFALGSPADVERFLAALAR